MFIRTRSLFNAFRQFTEYVRINIISELFIPVKKNKQFNFKLHSNNDPFIFHKHCRLRDHSIRQQRFTIKGDHDRHHASILHCYADMAPQR